MCVLCLHAEDGLRVLVRARGLGDVSKSQPQSPTREHTRRRVVPVLRAMSSVEGPGFADEATPLVSRQSPARRDGAWGGLRNLKYAVLTVCIGSLIAGSYVPLTLTTTHSAEDSVLCVSCTYNHVS